MSDTIREIVIRDIMARLAVVTVVNGYKTDCGVKEIQRVRKLLDPAELPAFVVWPGTEKPEQRYGELINTMSVRIEGITKFESENPSVVSEMILGDLKKCILSQTWTRSPDYIDKITYTGGGTDDYPDDGMISVGASATFDITYTEKIGDPYLQ
jgi:hypothetical protein